MSNVDDQSVVVMAWEGGDLDGIEIGCVVTSMAAKLAADRFAERVMSGKRLRGKHITALAAAFAAHVVRWNLRSRTGRPLPIGLPSLLERDKDVVMEVLRRWVAHVSSPPVAEQPEIAEPETEVESDGIDLSMLEARALQDPGPDEVLVEREEIPDLVDA